jgi:D-alanyl-D-alanine carboxypeptidase
VLLTQFELSREDAPKQRPELDRMLASLVSGPDRIAPGVVAYVNGPDGTWMGSAGVAHVKSGELMEPDARMRLESVSKIYTATIIHQLVEEGALRLDDTLEKWLPGMFAYGERVTVEQLLTHTSGIVDDNIVAARPEYYLSLIRDKQLRAELLDLKRRYAANPGLEFSPRIWVRVAAAVPLLFPPGTSYQYSNTGFEILGLITHRSTGKTMPVLFNERIVSRLGLEQTAWDPQGAISGEHAHGYRVTANGTLIDTTTWHGGIGAEGAIVSNAAETAGFMTGLMAGKLLGQKQLALMKHGGFWTGGESTPCGNAYGHSGGGAGFRTKVLASSDGSRIAVLLLNGRAGNRGDNVSARAITRLYCES